MTSTTHYSPQATTGHYSHEGIVVPYRIWCKPGRAETPLVVFLGSIQIGRLAQWVAEACPPNSFVIEGAPHWLAGDTDSEVVTFMLHYTQETFRAVRSLQTFDHVNVIAESQAVPGVLELFSKRELSPLLRSLRLVQPLGLNNGTYDSTESSRIATFQQRLRRNSLHQIRALITDGRLRHNHRVLYSTIRKQRQKHLRQYASGLRYDALPSLRTLAKLQPNITIFCGSKDVIFPHAEIRDSLAQNGLDVEIRTVQGVPHSPLATKDGQKLLAAAINSL